MNRSQPKRPWIRLQRDRYSRLCRQVLERDNWRCQNCGRTTELQIHHIQFRSQLGDDSGENLVTLCAACHRELHCQVTATPIDSQRRDGKWLAFRDGHGNSMGIRKIP
jgi:5-methylcytosine-specific restriction endonuclease McrA